MDWLLTHLETGLFRLGETQVTPMSLIVFAVTIALALVAARVARAGVQRVLSRNEHIQDGTAYAVGRIVQYVAIVGGVLLGLENVGVSITAFAALGALLSVGIGFGLQNIAQNFISGLILLIERPLQKGDVVELANGTMGRVDEIEMRATRIITLDGISILVPNSRLITDEVQNYHAPNQQSRLRVAVGVAYGSDTKLVRDTLLEVARSDGRILERPAPDVLFQDFGSSSLDFQLCVWLADAEKRPKTASDLRFAIDAAFRRNAIQIPFPQRDLHLVSGFEALREGDAATAAE